MTNNFKYPFKGSDSLSVSDFKSQAGQDLFVLSVLAGKTNGSYLEIGCNVPESYNNTFVLAKHFNWNGVSIDFLPELKAQWDEVRPNNKFLFTDALTLDYSTVINDPIIDYLQVDIEPSTHTFQALKKIPHDKYRFRVITFETDYYTGGDSIMVREESRKFLTDLGYTLIVGDVLVAYGGLHPFEDWYVDMNLVDQNIAKSIQNDAKFTQNPAQLLLNV